MSQEGQNLTRDAVIGMFHQAGWHITEGSLRYVMNTWKDDPGFVERSLEKWFRKKLLRRMPKKGR